MYYLIMIYVSLIYSKEFKDREEYEKLKPNLEKEGWVLDNEVITDEHL